VATIEHIAAVSEGLRNQAQKAARNKDPHDGLGALRRLALLEPSVPTNWIDLAGVLNALGRLEELPEPLSWAMHCADASGEVQAFIGNLWAKRGQFDRATTAFLAAYGHQPDNHKLGLSLATAQAKSRGNRAALATLTQIAERARNAGNTAALAGLANYLYTHGNTQQLVELVPDFPRLLPNATAATNAVLRAIRDDGAPFSLARSLTAREDLLRAKATFYPLSLILTDKWAEDMSVAAGWVATCAVAPAGLRQQIFDQPARQALQDLVNQAPACDYDLSVQVLLDGGDIRHAVELLFEAVSWGELPPEKYNRIIEGGRFAGHPVWHLCNPLFPAWFDAAADTSDVQHTWSANTDGLADGELLDSDTHWAWRREQDPIAEGVIDFATRVGRSGRILDIGCGFGSWLRVLIEEGGVDPTAVFGVDLHQGRIDAAIGLLRDWARENGEDTDAMDFETRLFACDILNDGQALSERLALGIDAATLFFVTGCFEDEDLTRFLGAALATRPEWILHATVTDKIPAYRGRDDDERFFEPLGYKLVDRRWIPDSITPRKLEAILLPQKYWLNRRMDIFQRTSD
jgi:SAM-dependent methyltransferase/tetratricopeptide (TPR) repeat protein